MLSLIGAHAGALLTNIYSTSYYSGFDPNGLVQARDGYFYGTSYSDGTNNSGTVFKVSSSGALTTLYSFSGGADGANPVGGLVQGRDGYLYGTTSYGGAYGSGQLGSGTVFRISTDGAFTCLYSLTGFYDGSNPHAGLIQGRDGYFYGTTYYGGTNDYGNVFKISPGGALVTLYSFSGGVDGSFPEAGLAQGSDGSIYGTTSSGGASNSGTVFKVAANGAFTSLHSFTGTQDGGNPTAAPVQGVDGFIYGTTSGGDTKGSGTVFRISTNGGLTSLYSFSGGNDGSGPGLLIQGSDGYFFGRTGWSLFKIGTDGAMTVLYSLTAYVSPNYISGGFGGLLQADDGAFYGTLTRSVGGGGGTVYRLVLTPPPPFQGGVIFTNLYSFAGNDGAYPMDALVQGSDGYFYGTTYGGGAGGCGGVFKISSNGVLSTLAPFLGGWCAETFAGLVQANDGYFYGARQEGPDYSSGSVFRISPSGSLTTLYSFTDGTRGGYPLASLVQGTDGYLYGTTPWGGTNDVGAVFKTDTQGVLTGLYSFTGGKDGARPLAPLVQARDGNFYGTTHGGVLISTFYGYGGVFKLDATGALSPLYSFSGRNDGAYPAAGLVQASDGYLYGTTSGGGTNGDGTVFKISTNGTLTSLYSFTGAEDGVGPVAGLVQRGDGCLYGTTQFGGARGAGTVFRISTNGEFTILHSFTGAKEGAQPNGGLAQGSDGGLYGTTAYGGTYGDGTVFRLTVLPPPVFETFSLTNRTLSLGWSAGAGGRYQLQYTSDLTSSGWSNLGPVLTATGATLSATDSLTNGSRRFYRATLLP
jgi:uncharacterized repeat protein (TIGR03803 family)